MQAGAPADTNNVRRATLHEPAYPQSSTSPDMKHSTAATRVTAGIALIAATVPMVVTSALPAYAANSDFRQGGNPRNPHVFVIGLDHRADTPG